MHRVAVSSWRCAVALHCFVALLRGMRGAAVLCCIDKSKEVCVCVRAFVSVCLCVCVCVRAVVSALAAAMLDKVTLRRLFLAAISSIL